MWNPAGHAGPGGPAGPTSPCVPAGPRLPGFPGCPGWPGGPVRPVRPGGPTPPREPGEPGGPVMDAPAGPGGPCGPRTVRPGSPRGPGGPCAPAAPGGPDGPAGPRWPGTPGLDSEAADGASSVPYGPVSAPVRHTTVSSPASPKPTTGRDVTQSSALTRRCLWCLPLLLLLRRLLSGVGATGEEPSQQTDHRVHHVGQLAGDEVDVDLGVDDLDQCRRRARRQHRDADGRSDEEDQQVRRGPLRHSPPPGVRH